MATMNDPTGTDYVANRNAAIKKAWADQGPKGASTDGKFDSPRSSNAGLGIDATVALGTAASNGRAGAAKGSGITSKEMNSGASVKNATNAENYGGKAGELQGSFGTRDNAGIFGSKGQPKGAKVVPAVGGQMSKSSAAIYGDGNSKAKGTQGFTAINRAKRGLNSGKGGKN